MEFLKPQSITSASKSEQKPLHLPSLARKLPDDWRWMRLDDVCSGIFDCPHSTPVLTAEGTFLARSQDILNGVFRSEAAARVSDETYSERTVRAEPTYGDLLYSREGTYFGIAAEVPKDARVCLGQRMVLLRPDAKRVNFRFLRYWLNSPVLAAHIHGHRDGTVAERLNLPTIRGLPVPVAPLLQQGRVASVLGALDDEIESNRRINETLQAMARALFQSWFVRFDPVRAKAEGHKPVSMDTATDAPFPDTFEDSPLGEIPTGWRTCEVGDAIEIGGGSTPSTKESAYWDGQIHWATPKDLSALRDPVLLDTERRITQAGVEQIGSRVYPEGSVLLSSRAPIGYLAISEVPVAVNQGMIAMACARNPTNHYMLQWTRANMDSIESRASGTTFQEISKSNFRSIPLAVPTDKVMRAFTERVEPLHRQIVANVRQSRTLSTIRDTLLPKLISGETRVSAARPVETMA